MKIRTYTSLCVVSALLAGAAGCKKETVQNTEDQIKSGTEKAVDATKQTANDAKQGAENAANAVKDGTAQVTGSVNADSVITKAKDLVASGKYQDALTELGKLKGMTLSDAQQQVVDGLKAEIQKGISSGASSLQNMMK